MSFVFRYYCHCVPYASGICPVKRVAHYVPHGRANHPPLLSAGRYSLFAVRYLLFVVGRSPLTHPKCELQLIPQLVIGNLVSFVFAFPSPQPSTLMPLQRPGFPKPQICQHKVAKQQRSHCSRSKKRNKRQCSFSCGFFAY